MEVDFPETVSYKEITRGQAPAYFRGGNHREYSGKSYLRFLEHAQPVARKKYCCRLHGRSNFWIKQNCLAGEAKPRANRRIRRVDIRRKPHGRIRTSSLRGTRCYGADASLLYHPQ